MNNGAQHGAARRTIALVLAGGRGSRLQALTEHWSGVSQQWDKVESLGKAYRAMQPATP